MVTKQKPSHAPAGRRIPFPLLILGSLAGVFAAARGLFAFPLWVSWLVAVNLTTLVTFAWDKSMAVHGGWRVPEKLLFGLALTGGIGGTLAGMALFQHKTSKLTFLTRIRWITAILVVTALAMVWMFTQESTAPVYIKL